MRHAIMVILGISVWRDALEREHSTAMQAWLIRDNLAGAPFHQTNVLLNSGNNLLLST